MRSSTSHEGRVEVFAPASVANVGPGYDCFGFAVENLGDRVAAHPVAQPGVRISKIVGDGGALPTKSDQNTASKAAGYLLQQVRCDFGLELEIHKGLPLCSGLGSSAASAVAGAVAARLVIEAQTSKPVDPQLVMQAALAGEQVASGALHADNVAPCLLGGFTMVRSSSPLDVVRFEPKLDLDFVTVTPEIKISTKEARRALPSTVPLEDAVANCADAASLVYALLAGDAQLFSRALQDRVVEPCRAKLIAGYSDAKQAALDAGALGFSISGSGPTVFAAAIGSETAQKCGKTIADVFLQRGYNALIQQTKINNQGARSL